MVKISRKGISTNGHTISRSDLTKKLEPEKVTSDEEFSELIDMAYQQGVIERSEREILNEIIKLDQKTAEEVMKPRSGMVCIEDSSNLNTMISFSKKHTDAC